mgnify:CR=1 FL=1
MIVAGCGRSGSVPEPEDASAEARPANTAAPVSGVYAAVTVVDLEGQPLAGMTPIATTNANAFDAPVAVGHATDDAGKSALVLPRDVRVYVRAWDPDRRYFANNYYDIPPAVGDRTEDMHFSMVQGASLEVRFVTPDGTSVANTNVGLMMLHPAKGPWWPDECDTDGSGAAVFASVPAGRFTCRFKAAGAGEVEIADVELDVGGHTNLGQVVVR